MAAAAHKAVRKKFEAQHGQEALHGLPDFDENKDLQSGEMPTEGECVGGLFGQLQKKMIRY